MASRRKEAAPGSGSKVRLSKSLAWLLRHNAEAEGFTLLPGGYLPVDLVLKHTRFAGFSVADVEEVVRDNDKQRFALRKSPETGEWQIRANQGHTIKVPSLWKIISL